MAGKRAILVGASGLVGGELLNLLLKAEDYEKVIIMGRRRLDIWHFKLKEIILDFNRLDDYKEYFHADEVFCCLGTTIKKAKTKEEFKKVDVDYVLNLARIAKEMEIEKFLYVSSVGADPHSRIFYSRMKGLVEEGLKEVGFASLHIFRPSLLLGKRQEVRLGEHLAMIVSKGISFILKGWLKQYKPIEAKIVAKGMLNTARKGKYGDYTYLSHTISELAQKETS